MPGNFLLDKFVLRIQLSFVLQALLLEELDPTIFLKHLLLDRGHLLIQLFILLVHDRVRAFGMSATVAGRGYATTFNFEAFLSDLDEL